MLTEIASSIKSPYRQLSSIPSIDDREHWDGLDPQLKKELIAQGEACLGSDYPLILATDYMSFVRTGDRDGYQDKAFRRRIALNTLVIAESVENQGRFLDDIVNGIVLICEESAWQIPAHNSYIRDTPQFILPDVTHPVIDLFAAETAAVLGVADAILRVRLDTIAPFIHTMIEDNLNRRIFTPYLTEHFWWMGDGRSTMNNWTVWCTQNILLAAFTRPLPAETQEAILRQACKSTDYFLAEYGDDGCCDEGAQYYRHAGLCLFNIIELLTYAAGDVFLNLYRSTKIRNIASYIMNVHAAGKYYINFADCSPIAGRCTAREFLFGRRTDNPQLMAFAAADYRRNEQPLLPEEHSLYYRLQTIFHYSEMLAYPEEQPFTCADRYYESVGLLIARDDTYCLAVKAGDNNDSHNHNDTGSFILYKNGRPMFIDVGVETYTQKTFSPQRYELWPMQSAFHNLITFGGTMQEDGAPFAARDVSVTLETSQTAISMELSEAYPTPQIRSYHREVTFIKGDHITIRDTVRTDISPAVLSLMTYEPPAWNKTRQTLTIGNLGTCQITSAASVAIEEIPITDNRLAQTWHHSIYRTLVTLNHPQIHLKIT